MSRTTQSLSLIPSHSKSTPILSPQSVPSPDLFRSCVADRSERIWTEFVGRFHDRLVRAVRRSLARFGARETDPERTEDLVQEVYCRLLGDGRRSRRFLGSSEGQLMNYLKRVVTSVVVDAHRRAQAEKRAGRGRAAVWLEEVPLSQEPVAPEGPEDRLLARERRTAFVLLCRTVLGRRASRSALKIARLALLEGWTSREIAATLDGRMGVAGIDTLVHRLRRSLSARGIAVPRRDHKRFATAPIERSRKANQARPRSGRAMPVR